MSSLLRRRLLRVALCLPVAKRQLAQQFVASVHYINRHHNLETLGPNDQIREVTKEPEQQEG